MAKRRSKSSLADTLGTKGQKAFDSHKTDDTSYGRVNLPPGIRNGIARLDICTFNEYVDPHQDSGKPRYQGVAIVVSPAKGPNGEDLKGARTQKIEPLFDTPIRSRKTEDEHIGFVLNEARKLGVDTDELDDIDDLKEALESLVEDGIYVKFSTSEFKPDDGDPMTLEYWNGVAEDYKEEESDEVEDSTGDDDEEEEELVEEEEEDGNEEEDEGEEETEEEDEDEEWVTASTEDEEDLEPEVGDPYYYKPPKKRKAIEVEVTKVFKGKQTATVKSVDDDTVYRGVPWDKLSEE